MILIIKKFGEALNFSNDNYYLWFEKLYQTLKTVSLDFQTLGSWLKQTWLHLLFSIHFPVFESQMKHSFLCSIYYTNIHQQTVLVKH